MGHGDGDSLAVWITGGAARKPTVIHLSSVVGTHKKEGGQKGHRKGNLFMYLLDFSTAQLHARPVSFSKRMAQPEGPWFREP